MSTRSTMPCTSCAGSGRIKRDRRKMEDGNPDPLDFRREELCLSCGGEGVVTNWGGKPAPVSDRQPGFVADQIGVTPFFARAQSGSFC